MVYIDSNSLNVINGTINVSTDPSLSIGNGGDIIIRNPFPEIGNGGNINLTPIPEPSSYLLLSLGLLALTYRLKRFNS